MSKKMLERTVLCVMILICGMSLAAFADTVTFRNGVNGYSGTNDVMLDDYDASIKNINMGALDEMTAMWNGNNHTSFLLKFAGVTLPAGAVIDEAYVSLYKSAGYGPAFNIDVSQVANANANWWEGSQVYAAAAAGEPSWNSMASPTAWVGGGGAAGGAVSLGTMAVDPAHDNGTMYNFILPSALVQQWVSGGINSGLLFRNLSADGATRMKFRTSESGPDGYPLRPMLTINYTVPEPTAMILLGLGALLIRRK